MAGVSMKATGVFEDLLNAYKSKKYEGYVLSGGSRSSKTWSIIQFILVYCQEHKNQNKDILIARQQYSDLKKTVMKDFFNILQTYGLYQEKDHVRSHPQSYRYFGNTIYFSGLDSGGAHGEAHDIIWINEAFEAEQDAFRQLNQRLNEFFILDYNPCFTEHWILSSILTQPKIYFSHSTMLNNPFLPQRVRDQILAYDPSNPVNVKNGTCDDYMWKVYGLGIGAQPEGIIFKYVTWINADEFPQNLDFWHGMDFGYVTDPTTIVKTAIDGKNLYLQELCYEPIDNPTAISEMMTGIGIMRSTPIIADSSDKYVSAVRGAIEMVKDLKKLGWNIDKVRKTQDIVYWINKMKEYKIHIVRTLNFKKEQEQYRWRMVNGIQVNQPIDKYNHCFYKDTLISTLNGEKRIIDVTKNDYVLTRNGYRKVLKSFHNGCRLIFDYQIDFGYICINIKCTNNHKFLTQEGWKQISKIKSGDTLFLNKNLTEELITCTKTKGISQKGEKECTGLCGNTLMEKFRKVLMSTIKMKTPKTTQLKILNLSLEKNIIPYTLKNVLKKIKNGLKSFKKMALRPQKCGIHLMLAKSGIQNMPKTWALEALLTENESAKFAVKTLLQKTTDKNFVQIIANQNLEESLELITKQGLVSIAEQNLLQTNIQNQHRVVSGVVKSIVSREIGIHNVYDLTIKKDHEFFANGILAHNCWDAARYSIMFNKLQKRKAFWD